MSDPESTDAPQPQAPPELDPAQVNFAVQRLRDEENFAFAAVAGTLAAALGAAAWTAVTVITEYKIGFMAVGVGFLVAYSIRIAGKGVSTKFQILGAALSLVGCLAGNFFTICYFIALNEGMEFLELLTQINPAAIPDLMIGTFSGMDLLFYGIAVYEGYRLSLRQVSEDELRGLTQPGAGAV